MNKNDIIKRSVNAFAPVIIFLVIREAAKLIAHNAVMAASANKSVIFGFDFGTLVSFEDVTAFLQSNSIYVTAFCNVVCIIIFLIMFRKDTAGEKETSAKPLEAVLSLAASLCIAIAVSNIIHFTQLDGVSSGYRSFQENYNSKDILILIIAMGIIAPVAEELCFRGLMYRRLNLIAGRAPAMTASALCFGLIHGNVPQFAYAAVLGLFLAYFYELSGNIPVPVICHIGINMLAAFMSAYGVLGWMYTNNMVLAGSTLVYASIAMMLIKTMKKTKG
ncbi:MAG: CPBP family intramembrane metalloprotease [Lachnospiraceae bacterium]|nr:CPBP family intramembrane metalloprotease [Lachnospiraceae bacterium]